MLMPTSGAEKKSVLVRLMSVRLYANRTWLNVDELMMKFSPPVNVWARLSRPPMLRHQQVLLRGRRG